MSAYIGHENATVYGAAKAGLLSYTRGLTYELKDLLPRFRHYQDAQGVPELLQLAAA